MIFPQIAGSFCVPKTSSQRAYYACEALPEFEQEAKARKVKAGKVTGRGNKKECQLIDTPLPAERAAAEAAEAFHTNRTYAKRPDQQCQSSP